MNPFEAILAVSRQAVDATDDLAGTLRLFHGFVECRYNVRCGGIVAQQIDCSRAVARDCRQWLVQLVRNTRCHFTHGNEARRGLQAILLLARVFICLLPLRNVHHRPHPAGMLSVGIDQGCLVNQHVDDLAAAAFELQFKALLGAFSREDSIMKDAGFIQVVVRPVRHWRSAADQFFR